MAHVIDAHHKELAKTDISLPSDSTSIVNLERQPRVYCGQQHGLNWQYNINAGSVLAQVHLHGRNSELYNDLELAFELPHGSKDFGNGLTGNGRNVISIKFEANVSDKQQWGAIAQKAVEEMNRLHEQITALLG